MVRFKQSFRMVCSTLKTLSESRVFLSGGYRNQISKVFNAPKSIKLIHEIWTGTLQGAWDIAWSLRLKCFFIIHSWKRGTWRVSKCSRDFFVVLIQIYHYFISISIIKVCEGLRVILHYKQYIVNQCTVSQHTTQNNFVPSTTELYFKVQSAVEDP